MKILVTGASGFTGKFMMEFLSAQQGVDPVGLIHSGSPDNHGVQRVSWEHGDLLNRHLFLKNIKEISPDAIIHLAGITHGPLDALLTTNVTGTKNLLDAAVQVNQDCRIIAVSSSAVYGYAGNSPVKEDSPLLPLSDYGISKMAQDALSLAHNKIHDTCVVVARPFNLVGPGQSSSFICGRLVNQIAEIENGQRKNLDLLEIRSARDFVDVRDVVKGYFALATHPEFALDCAGRAFNLGSGKATRISELLSIVENVTGSSYKINLPDQPPAIPLLSQQSDNSRIKSITGWKPCIVLEETIRDMLEYARKKNNG